MGQENDINARFPASLAVAPTVPGEEIVIIGSDNQRKVFKALYNETAAARTKGQVATIDYSNDYRFECIAPVSTAFPVRTCTFIKDTALHELAWMQTEGEAEASVEGTTNDVAAGDFLQVINAEFVFRKDGAARTDASGAVAIDAQAADSAVVVTVNLIGEQHIISAAV